VKENITIVCNKIINTSFSFFISDIMVHGIDSTKTKKKPWKTQMERDIMLNKDLKEAYYQGGKAVGQIVKPKKKKK